LVPIGTNYAPLLADLFLHAYGADILQGLLKNINDILSLKNSRFGDYLHHIYPHELEVKDTTDTQKFASHLHLHIEIDNRGRLKKTATTNMMTSRFQ
jgi:hypothetical protein